MRLKLLKGNEVGRRGCWRLVLLFWFYLLFCGILRNLNRSAYSLASCHISFNLGKDFQWFDCVSELVEGARRFDVICFLAYFSKMDSLCFFKNRTPLCNTVSLKKKKFFKAAQKQIEYFHHVTGARVAHTNINNKTLIREKKKKNLYHVW